MINDNLKFLKYKIPVGACIPLASSFIHAFCKIYMYFFLLLSGLFARPYL